MPARDPSVGGTEEDSPPPSPLAAAGGVPVIAHKTLSLGFAVLFRGAGAVLWPPEPGPQEAPVSTRSSCLHNCPSRKGQGRIHSPAHVTTAGTVPTAIPPETPACPGKRGPDSDVGTGPSMLRRRESRAWDEGWPLLRTACPLPICWARRR